MGRGLGVRCHFGPCGAVAEVGEEKHQEATSVRGQSDHEAGFRVGGFGVLGFWGFGVLGFWGFGV